MKVFPNSDILVKSGARRCFVPLRLNRAPIDYGSLVSQAFTGDQNETVIDGVSSTRLKRLATSKKRS